MNARRSSSREEPKHHPGGPSRNRALIEQCQGLLRLIAWRIHRKLPPYVDIQDLFSSGQVGLAQAARDYDPSRGKFTTYAYFRIRGSILDDLSRMSWFSRLDYYASRYEEMSEDLRAEGATPNPAVHDRSRWLKRLARRTNIVSLDASANSASSIDALIDHSSPAEPAMEGEVFHRLHEHLDTLPFDARNLLRSVYFEGCTLQDAGRKLGISKAWASRLHAKALERLERSLRRAGVEG